MESSLTDDMFSMDAADYCLYELHNSDYTFEVAVRSAISKLPAMLGPDIWTEPEINAFERAIKRHGGELHGVLKQVSVTEFHWRYI